MERLTIKNSDGTYSQPTHTTFEKMFYKLAEFEDFMEQMGFESLDDIKDMIHTWSIYRNATGVYYKEAEQEKQTLKDRWQKLKEYIDTFKEYNIEEANLAWKIINKIQELENGE